MGLFNSSKAGFGTRAEAEGLTRGLLVELIYKEFVRQLESETTEDQMLFPASYTIYLSSTDFEKRKSGFPFTVKELVHRFNSAFPDHILPPLLPNLSESRSPSFPGSIFPSCLSA